MSREMQESRIKWIGKIPKSWNTTKVKNSFVRKKSKPTTENYNILSLARSGIKIRDISTGEGQIASDYSHYNPVAPGDILLNPMDLVSGDNSNISEVEGVISQAYFNLRARDGYNPYFYNYYFKLQYWLGSFFSHGKGVSFKNRWTLNAETISNFPILVPSLDEQNTIVNFLDEKTSDIDNIIEKTKQSIEGLKAYKQSLITEIVTKGLNSNATMKDSGIEWIGGIPEHWNKNMIEDNLLSLSYGNIIRKNINTTDGLLPASFENYNILEKGDIVLRMTDLQNDHKSLRTGYVNERGIITSAYITLRTKHDEVLNKKYIQLFLHAFDIYKGFYGMGAGVRQSVNYNDLKKLPLIVPPIEEQNDIVEFLHEKIIKIDNLITKKELMIDELESYKQSLIYEYVTGKKEVK